MSDFLINPYVFAAAAPASFTVSASTSSATGNVTAPSRSAGDRLFTVLMSTNQVTSVTDWTVVSGTSTQIASFLWFAVFTRTATNTSNDNFTTSGAGGSPAVSYMAASQGGGATITASAFNGAGLSGGSASGTVPAVTSPGSGTDVVFATMETNGSPGTTATPSGFSAVTNSLAFGASQQGVLFSRSVTAGSTGTTAISHSGASGIGVFAGARLVLT